MHHTRGLTLVTALALSGCYRYVPETAPSLAVGQVYRAHLTSAGSVSLAPVLGRDVIAFEGHVLSSSDTAFTVSMAETLLRSTPQPTIWAGEAMTVPRVSIERFERRELDRGRSMKFAALYAVGGFLAGRLLLSMKGKASGEPGGPPGGPPPP